MRTVEDMQQHICADMGNSRHNRLQDKNHMMLYRLSLLPEFGAVTIRKLYDLYAPFEEAIYIEEKQLKAEAGLSDIQLHGIRNLNRYADESYKSYLRMQEEGIKVVTFLDDDYPYRLRNIPQAPAVLYIRGELPEDDIPSVAMVGSRAATNYGIGMAEFLSEILAENGVNIISGMAHGIDGAAHRGALKTDEGKTYAVLGGGVNICYPKENYDIYEILKKGARGGLISEVAPGINPLKANFPMRNRIISGLSDIVIIIEAREHSGSLITAGYALDQSRDVMALPGRITDPMSRGCNSLIASGAAILTSPDDILELLSMKRKGKLEIPDKTVKLLAKKEKVVYSTLDLQPKYVQQIVDETGLTFGEAASILLELELKGLITQYSAGYYGIQ